jgi:hypothetical protein
MNEILLTPHTPSDSDLERLNLFAGRHMGEDEFERQQAYVDRRLANVFAAMQPGIVTGLQAKQTQIDNKGGVNVSAGLAVAGNGQALGLYYPLSQTWQTLIDAYLAKMNTHNPMGVFYLTLERNTRYVNEDVSMHPEQRTEFDPTRDAMRLVVGSLGLFRLAVSAEVAATLSREQIENTIAARHVDTQFMSAMNNAVPLGLVFIDDLNRGINSTPNYGLRWFSATAGQYHATHDSGYQVLLNQTREAFSRILKQAYAQEALTPANYLAANLRLDFLPAAGELPVVLLRNLASRNAANPPGIAWLPSHISVDIVPVPEESVPALIDRHLSRRLVDLRQASGERLRLLLAVNEPDYKPNLMDVPEIDQLLKKDIYRYFMRSYDIWAEWKRQFDLLYHLPEEAKLQLTPDAITAMDLPKPVDYPEFPNIFFAREGFFSRMITSARQTLGLTAASALPYPYDGYDASQTAWPEFYRQWTQRWQTRTTDTVDPRSFPLHENPNAATGLVVQYTAATVDLEALDTQIRTIRSRVERTRDYLLLQRQQLDNQTVSLAALAGGVAGDGSGMQVARWLPFTKLKASKEVLPTTTPDTQLPIYKLATTNFISLKANTSIANTAQSLLTKSAFNKSNSDNLVFSSTLRKSPSIFSSLQFNLNNSRLDKIAEAPKQALTKPAFDAKEFRFGVLEHISPHMQEYKKATRGMTELISTLKGMFDAAEAKQLETKLKAYGTPLTYQQIQDEISGQAAADKEDLNARVYEEMFKLGKILTQQIALMEGRYEQLETKLQGLLRARINKEDEIEKLTALIRTATEQLTAIDKRRIEFLGDYGVAQRLIDDDWMDVYKLNEERTRVLTKGIKGLYYIRALQTPISESLADPLQLRYSRPGDIVPGCDGDIDPDLPDDLDDFFETVLEIPMAAWADLQNFKYYIPTAEKLTPITNVRQVRLNQKLDRQHNYTTPVGLSLFGIRQQTQATLHQWTQLLIPINVVSIKQQQQEASHIISLADLMTTTKGPLQKQAQHLHNRLEQAAWCMLEKLNLLPPSLRLQWAQLAEDDRLPVDRVALWPGLERAERDDFNATRTLAEIIAWWFKQLDSDATATARSAMRNMVRATLIHAAMGDPAEILQGSVQVPPRRFLSGELMRLQLNRAPKLGTLLQLLDTQQRVVALLNVDDHDDKGTVARITQITNASLPNNALVTTQFKVVANKSTMQFSQTKLNLF